MDNPIGTQQHTENLAPEKQFAAEKQLPPEQQITAGQESPFVPVPLRQEKPGGPAGEEEVGARRTPGVDIQRGYFSVLGALSGIDGQASMGRLVFWMVLLLLTLSALLWFLN